MMKQKYYHLMAIATVTVWGLTFISTKVLIQQGLSPQEIFFYRFLIAYVFILQEQITWVTLLGAGCIVVGVSGRKEREQPVIK